MAEEPDISEKDIPDFVRRCWQRYQDATKDLREASIVSRKMVVGGKLQWRDGEIPGREAANRPYITINRCAPAIAQIVNEAIANPPGPKADPVGGGADKDGADVIEGMIREYEYRSDAQTAYVLGALQSALAGNQGVFELATEYCGERSFDQQLTVKFADDESCYFYDPDARKPCREDSAWGGKVRVMSRDRLIEEYGRNLKVLSRNMVDRWSGWIASAVNWPGQTTTVATWTGAKDGTGPFYVCEFYRRRTKLEKLTQYSDGIGRFASEEIPDGVTPVEEDGEIQSRMEPKPTIEKYVVTALDVIKGPNPWLGTQIPHFWVMGPEMYIDGKLYRSSAIDGAIDSQRGLNYAATAAVEVVSSMNKSGSVLGFVGQFDVANAQGINPWLDFSSKIYPYMEVKPTFAVNPSTGLSEQLPLPQRNSWEAPIARMLELASWFGEQIKAATSVFFDPTIRAGNVESGEALKELQQQTNIGTANWQQALRRAVGLSYKEAAIILPQITPRQRAQAIVRADLTREVQEINREYPETTHERLPNGNYKHKETGKIDKAFNITRGQYALRVTAGPNQQTRTEEALDKLFDLLKIVPQIAGAPGILPQIVRLVAKGSPQMEQMADSLMPQGMADMTPDQMRQQILGMQQSDQAKQQLIEKLTQALAAKLPEIESREKIETLKAAVTLAGKEIDAKSQTMERADADRLTHDQIAHEVGLKAMDHEQANQQQAADQQHQAAMPAVQAAAQPEPQPNGAA